MRNMIKLFVLSTLVCLSFTVQAQYRYGVTCKKGFQKMSEQKIVDLYANAFELKGAKFGKVKLDKLVEPSTGELIVFIKTKVFSNDLTSSIVTRIYRTTEGGFSLNAPQKKSISMTLCKCKDQTSKCEPVVTSNGVLCQGAVKKVVEVASICK